MKLALRRSPDSGQWNHRAAAAIIRIRLMTRYPHAGIVIGDTLHHATASHGVASEPFTGGDNWRLVDVGGDDVAALALFEQEAGKGYDWFSLLAFALIPATDSRRWYCYELAHYLMTGQRPKDRVTPEDLILLAHDMAGGDL